MTLSEHPTDPARAHHDLDAETLRAHHRAEVNAAIVALWVVGALAVFSVVVFAALASTGSQSAGVVLPVAVVVLGVLAVAGVRLVRTLRRIRPPRFDTMDALHHTIDEPAATPTV